MSEFDLFDQIIGGDEDNEIDLEISESEDSHKVEKISDCQHLNQIRDKSTVTCMDCGECMYKIYNQQRDYKSQRTRNITEDKNIFKDVESIKFSENIVQIANSLYVQVTNDKIFRGNARKGIISACIFHAFKIIGKPQIYKKIIQLFNITKKVGLKGLKFVSIHAPKDSVIFKTQITPVTFIEYYMEELKAQDTDIYLVKNIYSKIENIRNKKLNRSRPQSVASGVVYYWILINGKNITLKTFSKITELSELTIAKLEKDIRQILQQ